MSIRGSCHCGNIAYEFDWAPAPQTVVGRACSCGFCRRHGAAWTSNPDAALRLRIAEPGQVARHAFATGTADFLVCRRCGIAPVVLSRIEDRDYAVVNVRTIDADAGVRVEIVPMSLPDEDAATRLARRRRNWTPVVDPAPG